MSSLFKVLQEMLLEALGNLHYVMWIWETLDPQRVWRDSLICGKNSYYDLGYVTKTQFVILKWRSQNFMKSQKRKYWNKICPGISMMTPRGTSSQYFSLYVNVKFARKLFPHSYNEATVNTKGRSTLSQPFEHVNVAPTLHMLSSSLCHAALHWLKSMNYSSSLRSLPPSPAPPSPQSSPNFVTWCSLHRQTSATCGGRQFENSLSLVLNRYFVKIFLFSS